MLKQRSVFRFLFVLALMMAVTVTATASVMSTPSVALNGNEEAAAVGGDNCDVAEGLAWGLGIAGIFGCLLCAAGSIIIGTGTLFLC